MTRCAKSVAMFLCFFLLCLIWDTEGKDTGAAAAKNAKDGENDPQATSTKTISAPAPKGAKTNTNPTTAKATPAPKGAAGKATPAPKGGSEKTTQPPKGSKSASGKEASAPKDTAAKVTSDSPGKPTLASNDAPTKQTPAPKEKATAAPKEKVTAAPKAKATPAPKGKATPAPKGKATPAPKGKATATVKAKNGVTPTPLPSFTQPQMPTANPPPTVPTTTTTTKATTKPPAEVTAAATKTKTIKTTPTPTTTTMRTTTFGPGTFTIPDSSLDSGEAYSPDGYRYVNIDHHSSGGPIQRLNSLNALTVINLDEVFSHSYNITGWQYYAESLMPFYATIFTPISVDRNTSTFKIAVRAYNLITPPAVGAMEVRLAHNDVIMTQPGDLYGIFYTLADMKKFSDFPGTVPVEGSTGVHSPGYGDLFKTEYCLVFPTPPSPYKIGTELSTTKYTHMTIALRAVEEPDVHTHSLPHTFRQFQSMTDMISQGYVEVNLNRLYGGICEDGRRTDSLAEAWGDEVCRRSNNMDPDWFMLFDYTVDGSQPGLSALLPKPILFNPNCDPTIDQFLANACVSQRTCTIRQTPVLVCARTSRLKDILNVITDTLSSNILADTSGSQKTTPGKPPAKGAPAKEAPAKSAPSKTTSPPSKTSDSSKKAPAKDAKTTEPPKDANSKTSAKNAEPKAKKNA